MYDKIIIGAGLYGLYSALYCGIKGERILVLEKDDAVFSRATYVNQARVHNGYHYPRSYSTASKSKTYFERFNHDYLSSILMNFDQIYAMSSKFSWTSAKQFEKFCSVAKIRCDYIWPSSYFKPELCDGAYLTTEYTYDAMILKNQLLSEIEEYKNIEIKLNCDIKSIIKDQEHFIVEDQNQLYQTVFLLNSTYASINQINQIAGFEPFNIKYELCEIILCKVSESLKNIGITVMDGPFFSIMPFGKTGLHSLTSVSFTPHQTSFNVLPEFKCQSKSLGTCSPEKLGNCNICPAKPKSAWPYMKNLARKYLKDEYEFEYVESIFSMKPILKKSEIDDSRPTLIRVLSHHPTFVSVLSGKINTIYDLEEVLDSGNI